MIIHKMIIIYPHPLPFGSSIYARVIRNNRIVYLSSTLVDHGPPWSTMVDHGRTVKGIPFSIQGAPFKGPLKGSISRPPRRECAKIEKPKIQNFQNPQNQKSEITRVVEYGGSGWISPLVPLREKEPFKVSRPMVPMNDFKQWSQQVVPPV